MITEFLSGPQIGDSQLPQTLPFVPPGINDLVHGLNNIGHVLLFAYLAEVGADLLSRGEEVGPGLVGLPGELVIMTRHIASTTGVSILKPGPSDIFVLLVDDMFVVLKIETHSPYHVDTACSRTDSYDANMLWFA